jgi:hypothetical protein
MTDLVLSSGQIVDSHVEMLEHAVQSLEPVLERLHRSGVFCTGLRQEVLISRINP